MEKLKKGITFLFERPPFRSPLDRAVKIEELPNPRGAGLEGIVSPTHHARNLRVSGTAAHRD